jgi:hypothetical protein
MNEQLVLLLCLLVPSAWALLCVLGSACSGWRALAKRYRADVKPQGKTHWMQTVKLGWCGYKGCVNVTVASDGLYLAVLWPWRPGHPPLCIPLAELIDVRDERCFLGGRLVKVSVGRPKITTLRLPAHVFEGIDLPGRHLAS